MFKLENGQHKFTCCEENDYRFEVARTTKYHLNAASIENDDVIDTVICDVTSNYIDNQQTTFVLKGIVFNYRYYKSDMPKELYEKFAANPEKVRCVITKTALLYDYSDTASDDTFPIYVVIDKKSDSIYTSIKDEDSDNLKPYKYSAEKNDFNLYYSTTFMLSLDGEEHENVIINKNIEIYYTD